MTWLVGSAVVLLLVLAVGVWEAVRALRHLTVQQAALVQLLQHLRDEAGPRDIAKAVWSEMNRRERLDRQFREAGL